MRNLLSRIAARRCCYTNETFENARARLRPDQAPLPAAQGREQSNFEAAIFDELLKTHHQLTEYTFGIRRVCPLPDSLELEVESEERAKEILSRFLPACDETGEEVSGLLGLRVTKYTKRGIELHVAGQETSLWLTGLPIGTWRNAERGVLDSTQAAGWQPLWRKAHTWSRQELAFEARWNTGEWNRQMHTGAWCTSGLLRRIPLFHRMSPAQVVTGFKGLPVVGYDGFGPVRWVFEIDFPDTRHHADSLVDLLTDHIFGLPLAPALHLEESQGKPLPPNIRRLDDAERTALLEMRLSTNMYRSYINGHPETAGRIQHRVAAVLAKHEANSRSAPRVDALPAVSEPAAPGPR
ncbi:hypothetical protein ACFWP3_35815 [Streptomyces sp. NPDC058525]|uniref:hypothetical protein n=1 Tax=Streptomyces sp. NPDC058525 TaxID=3346538 RepID=UPI00365659ED